MEAGMLPRLNSLWVGSEIGWIEELCLRSALAMGHAFTLYSYTPEALRRLPSGVELRDAREVMPEASLLRYGDSGAVQLGSNLFRYHLLAKSLGYWVDMDFYFIRPIALTADHVFGYERPNSINSAILNVPAQSEMLRVIFQTMRPNVRPPWYGPKRTMQYYWRRLTRGTIQLQDLPWGTYGPQLVTYAVKAARVGHLAHPISVFYPVNYDQVHILVDPTASRRAIEHDKTLAIHLYRSALVRALNSGLPPPGSYLADACRAHGVNATAS